MNGCRETLSRDINRQVGGKEAVNVLAPSHVAEKRFDSGSHRTLKTGSAVGHHGHGHGKIDERVVQKESIAPDPVGWDLEMIFTSYLKNELAFPIEMNESSSYRP